MDGKTAPVNGNVDYPPPMALDRAILATLAATALAAFALAALAGEPYRSPTRPAPLPGREFAAVEELVVLVDGVPLRLTIPKRAAWRGGSLPPWVEVASGQATATYRAQVW